MRVKNTIIFFLILSFLMPQAYAADYGEDNAALGQVTDDFEDDDLINTFEDTIRNESLECVELNVSALNWFVYPDIQWREHDYTGAASVCQMDYQLLLGGTYFRYSSYSTAQRGMGWTWITVNRDWMDGKYFRFRYYRWMPGLSGGYAYTYWRLYVMDGTYDRSSDTDFPDGALIPTKGAGQLYYYAHTSANANAWYTIDRGPLDLSAGTEENCTIFMVAWDVSTSINVGIYFDYWTINTEPAGAGNLWIEQFTTPDRTFEFERLATEHDYGFIDEPTGLFTGGFENDGYMITEDYLDNANGSSLVLLTNTTIPAGCNLTVEFSDDEGTTWVDNENAAGFSQLFNGFQAVDLRYLNFTDIIYRYNFTKPSETPGITPRLYQSRLITTSGVGGTEGPSEDEGGLMPGLAIGIALLIIAYVYLESRR